MFAFALNCTARIVLTSSSKIPFMMDKIGCRIPQINCMITQLGYSRVKLHSIHALVFRFKFDNGLLVQHCLLQTSDTLVQFQLSSLYLHSKISCHPFHFKLHQLLNLNTTVFIIYKTSFVLKHILTHNHLNRRQYQSKAWSTFATFLPFHKQAFPQDYSKRKSLTFE